MSKKRTEQCRYLSPSSPDVYVTAAQYIAELVSHKRAHSLKRNLPVRFWRLDNWRAYFLYQVRIACELLKTYPEKAVVRALSDPRSFKTYSLRNPRLRSIIEEKKKEIEAEDRGPQKEAKVYTDTTQSKPRERPIKKSTLNTLMEFDTHNGEKEEGRDGTTDSN